MRLSNSITMIVLLALLSVFGIVLLLLLDDVWSVFMLLVVAPMLFGGYRAWVIGRKGSDR